MRFLTFRVENFQGLKSYEIDPKFQDIDILGDNGTGKTTMANAMIWLFTGKPYTGEAGYSPKTLDKEGGEVHNIDHTVEASLELDDHTMVTLRRTLSEVWKKKRGTQTPELSGNKTSYAIDDVPVDEDAFNAKVDKICPAAYVSLLMLPRAFAASLPWKRRREILLEICGDVTDDEVISNTPELAKSLPDYLSIPGNDARRYTVDEYRERAAAQLKKINAELQALPSRIDEAERATPELSEIETAALALDVDSLLVQKRKILSDIDTARQGGDSAARKQLAAEISDAEKAVSDAKAEYYRNQGKGTDALRKKINELNDKRIQLMDSRTVSVQASREIASKADKLESDRQALLKKYQSVSGDLLRINAEEYDGSDICPTCGQRMPMEMIDKARAAFNDDKARRIKSLQQALAGIQKQGKEECSESIVKGLRAQAAVKKSESDDVAAESQKVSDEIKQATAQLLALPTFESTDSYKQLQDKLAKIKGRENDLNASAEMGNAIAGLQKQLDDVNGQIDMIRAAEQKQEMRKRQDARIADLEAQQKQLGQEYERIQRGIFLCEGFMRAKVKMLDERINSRFRSVRFRLFETQINGGLKDCCDVLIPCQSGLIPYASANNAAQINAGIEIIDVLSQHIGASMPIIIDNAESVNQLQNVSAQIVRLIVSHDKKIRAEVRPLMEKESA